MSERCSNELQWLALGVGQQYSNISSNQGDMSYYKDFMLEPNLTISVLQWFEETNTFNPLRAKFF